MNKEQILGIVRHVLTFVGGLSTIIGAVWSFFVKIPAVVTPVETPVAAKKGK